MSENNSQPGQEAKGWLDRLFAYWVYGGALAGVLLLVLSPLLARHWPLVVFLTFLHLPVYMLHQYEEHDDDRFRTAFNTVVGRGREILSRADVFVINIFGVWGVIVISLYLAATLDLGYALIAVYLVIVNGVAHIAQAIVLQSYNPGFGSAIVLFLPFAGYTLWQVQRAGAGRVGFHAIGFLVAIGIHAAIIIYSKLKRTQMVAI